jgi:hypothetical protein
MKKVFFCLVFSAILVCSMSYGQTFDILKTGQTNSCVVGDDGDLQRGITAPDPRFLDNADGTIIDLATGLMWVQAPHSLSNNASSMTWTEAITFCNELEFAGHDDWVLPSRRELMSLLDYGHLNENLALPDGNPFSGLAPSGSGYWTGTSSALDSNSAWRVYINMASVLYGNKGGFCFVWPVRSWQ